MGAPDRDSGRSVDGLVRELYPVLAAGDAEALARLLAPDFEADVTPGLPLSLGGRHRGREATLEGFWLAIGRAFDLRAEPSEWVPCDGDRLLVIGRYVGSARATGASLDTPFMHLWQADGGRISSLTHLTDSAAWAVACEPGEEGDG